LLRDAVQREPKANSIRLNLAKALVMAGDKKSAREQLELLAKLGDAFPAQKEVRDLLTSL
jgi:FimV-like protein